MDDVGREDFHHHGEAEFGGRGDGGFDAGAGALRGGGDAGRREQALGFGLGRGGGGQGDGGHRGRRAGGGLGEGVPEAVHGSDGDDGAGGVLEDREAFRLVARDFLGVGEDRQDVEPVRVFVAGFAQGGEELGEDRGGAAGLREEAEHGGVTAVGA